MASTAQPTADEVRQELDRLLEDATFRRAPSHSRLLRYLVERKTAGDDGALCEAGIAMAVFQRDPAAYDAEIDPIVRVSIGRLRERLEKHYQRFDRVPETIIMLPRGRYTPEFRHRPNAVVAKPARGLAVMHTSNSTGDPAFDALAHGLSERLSEALVVMGLPRVIAPAAVAQVQPETRSPAEIGRQVGVSEIVETAISAEPNQRLRISARLIRVPDSELAWAEVRTIAQDNAYAGVDALFDAVLSRFAAAPGMQSSPSGQSPRRSSLPPAARGRIESARMLITHLSVSSIDQARTLLGDVISEFPEAADAWALRARACVRRLNFGDLLAPPLVAELEECVRSALALDPDHLEALALRALVLHWGGSLLEAEAQFRDMLRAAPNHTSARLGYAWLLVAQGRFDEALVELDAASSFDPLSLNVLFNRGCVLAFARQHDEAREVFETGLRAGGESLFALSASAGNECWGGDLDRAESLFRRCSELVPASATGAYGLAYIAAMRGDGAGAHALAAKARRLAPTPAHCREAEINALLGDTGAALAALRQGIAAMENGRVLLGVNWAYERMAGDPEFVALLGRLGLTRWCGVRSTPDG